MKPQKLRSRAPPRTPLELVMRPTLGERARAAALADLKLRREDPEAYKAMMAARAEEDTQRFARMRELQKKCMEQKRRNDVLWRDICAMHKVILKRMEEQ